DNWASRTHVNGEGKVIPSARGYTVEVEKAKVSGGLRASPLVTLRSARACAAATIAEFWQQFPCEIEVDPQKNVLLLEMRSEGYHELQGGEQKIYPLWFHFGPPDAGVEPLAWVHQPLHIHLPSEWYARCGAVPPLAPGFDDPGARLQQQV